MNDRRELEALNGDKDYRDAYLETCVHSYIPYQIQALRDQRELNQTEFARLIGKPQSVVSRLEATLGGRITIQTLLDIACALDIGLNVQFVPYDVFLENQKHISPTDMEVDGIQCLLERIRVEDDYSGKAKDKHPSDPTPEVQLTTTDPTAYVFGAMAANMVFAPTSMVSFGQTYFVTGIIGYPATVSMNIHTEATP